MARSQRKAAGSRGAGARSSTKSKSKKKAPVAAEVEVVEEEGGMGIDDGIAITTTVILLAAILMVDYLMASYFGTGTLFGDLTGAAG